MVTPGNFSCGDALEHLDDYRRNAIEPHLRVMVSEHLERCDSCAAELKMRVAMAGHLHSALPGDGAPTQLPPAVRRAISQVSPVRQKSTLLPWMLTAAAVITIGVAALQVNSSSRLTRNRDIASAPAREVSAEAPVAGKASVEDAVSAAPAPEAQHRMESGAFTGEAAEQAAPVPEAQATFARRAAEPQRMMMAVPASAEVTSDLATTDTQTTTVQPATTGTVTTTTSTGR